MFLKKLSEGASVQNGAKWNYFACKTITLVFGNVKDLIISLRNDSLLIVLKMVSLVASSNVGLILLSWASAEIFPGGATSKFYLSFSSCWRCNVNERSQNALPFLHRNKNAPRYGNSHKKCASLTAVARYIVTICDLHSTLLQIFNAGYFY